MSEYIWTSESVSPGHPDKIADCISDAILDLYLGKDPDAKVACEVMVKNENIFVSGEITSNAKMSKEAMDARIWYALNRIGYDETLDGFNANSAVIHYYISEQSPEINKAVVAKDGTTAGDQGIMFGFASRETESSMPLGIYLANKVVRTAWKHRNNFDLRPDMKSQVSIKYVDGKPVGIDNIVLSMCHGERYYRTLQDLRDMFHNDLMPIIVGEIPEESIKQLFDTRIKWHINPAGLWNVGGPISDCGLTGRKIVVDQYGADCEIGGGAFSGKDPSKVDRSGAYMARHIALKTLKHFEETNKIKVQLSYIIGRKELASVRIWDPTTGIEYPLVDLTMEDLTPDGIINHLRLKRPIYLGTALYGHFGNKMMYDPGIVPDWPWEKV